MIVCFSLMFPVGVKATLIIGNNSTIDTNSNLEWLHLSETYSFSANEIHDLLKPSGTYFGWRYASSTEFNDLIDGIGGTPNQSNGEDYRGWSAENNGIADTFSGFFNPNGSSLGAYGFIGEYYNHPQSTNPAQWVALVYDNHHYFPSEASTMDSINTFRHPSSMDYTSGYTGHFLVRAAVVSEPTTASIFITCFLLLVFGAKRVRV